MLLEHSQLAVAVLQRWLTQPALLSQPHELLRQAPVMLLPPPPASPRHCESALQRQIPVVVLHEPDGH